MDVGLLGTAIHAHAGSVRVGGKTQVGPISVPGKDSPLVADVRLMARTLEAVQDNVGARNEARMAIKLQPTAEAYLVLARLDQAENKLPSAAQNVERALVLDPANAAAAALQHEIAAGLTGKVQQP